MDVFVALLRAVNVGGTGKLAMAELATLCTEAGFGHVRTIGVSGNVVFRACGPEPALCAALAGRLRARSGRDIGVIVRTDAELDLVCAHNPFAHADPARVMALFFDGAMPSDPLAGASGLADEQIRPGARALYVFYPGGAGASRLRLPLARHGTARNMNTLAKLAAAARQLAAMPPCSDPPHR